MHDLSSVIIADKINQITLRDAYLFHSKSNNRNKRDFTPFAPLPSNLSAKEIADLEYIERKFGGSVIDCEHSSDAQIRRPSSAYKFSKEGKLEYNVFSTILYESFGEAIVNGNKRRPYPSGGAFYPIQIVLHVRNVNGLTSGCYHYLPSTRRLEKLISGNEKDIQKSLFLESNSDLEAYDFVIFYTSLAAQHIVKYGLRGYRLSLLEAGSAYQACLTACSARGLETRIWGGFEDDSLAVACGIDPRVAWPIVCQLVGRSQ